MSEWQPIDTAPKDGSRIFVWARPKSCFSLGPALSSRRRLEVKWETYRDSGYWEDVADCDGAVEDAILWHPIPSPPTT